MENLENAIASIKAQLPGLTLLENEPLSAHCSFHIGGPARALALPSDISALSKICCLLKEHKLAPFILGKGSNLLFPDEGLAELFILSTERLDRHFLLPDGALYAEAGLPLTRLSGFAQQKGLRGLEFASGIPGSLGGGCIMNAGAYGGELKDLIESVVCYYLPTQSLVELSAEECAFGYRSSVFQRKPGFVVLSAVLRLEKDDPEQIAARMRELGAKRREKQPLDLPSAGSAFKRPEGGFAAALIEQAGLKGYRIGGAQVSEKHAGFVVNTGGATSHDVHALMRHIRKTVHERSGVLLEPEMILLAPDYKLADNGPAVPRHQISFNAPPMEPENEA